MHDDEIIWIHNLMDISNGKYNYNYIYLKKIQLATDMDI